jgi:lactoylglutathione lyase
MRYSITTIFCLGVPMALSCNLQTNLTSPLPYNQTIGDDCPADPATSSYFINHASVTVSNITATKEWYRDVLGMRHMFTVELSDKYTIMYMGHSQGGRNGRGYQEGKELARDKNNLAGLMEFVEYKVPQFPFRSHLVRA